MSYSNRKKYNSDIWIGGKRISEMREIAKTAFEDSFFSIEIDNGKFIIRVDDSIDIERYKKFVSKYELCKVIIYKPIDFSSLNR